MLEFTAGGRQLGARGPMRNVRSAANPAAHMIATGGHPEISDAAGSAPVCLALLPRFTAAVQKTRGEPHGEQRIAAERTPHRPQARPGPYA
jgi:hypothetical protein